MKTKTGTSAGKRAVEAAVTGGLFLVGLAVVGAMIVLNRTLGGVELSPPIERAGKRGRAGVRS